MLKDPITVRWKSSCPLPGCNFLLSFLLPYYIVNAKKYTVLLFALVAGCLPAQIRVLTVEEACRLAEQNSISLQKQAVDLEIDRIRAKSLWAQVFPSINARGEVNYTFKDNNTTYGTNPLHTTNLSATVRLGLSAGLPLTMANISLAYKNSLLNYEQARRILINETSKTFYSLLSRKNNLLVLEGAMRLAGEQVERDRIARRSGYIGELDFLSAQVSSERAKLAYNRALADYQNTLGKFCTALGLDQKEPPVLEGNPEIIKLSLDAEALINERLARRPDMIAQRNEIQRLKNGRTETFLSSKGPSVDLSATWRATVDNGLSDGLSAGVSVSIPIDSWIPRTKPDQTVKRSNAEYQKAQLELRNMENNARQEIRSFTDSINITWTELEIARFQSDFAQRAYELAERAYRSGTMNFLNFETVRNRLTDARQQLLQCELNYKILVLDLASSLNMEERELRNYSTN